VSMNVSWHQLQQLQSVLHKTQTKGFAGKRKTPKYGSLSKAFSDMQLQRFLHVIDSDKFRLLFSYQAQLGLRIGEAVRVNINSIDLETRELTLKTEKAQVMDSLLIPMPLFKDTIAFISKHRAEIEKAQGYLFYADKLRTKRSVPFLEQNYVRNRFRHYVRLAGLDEVYDTSDETNPNRSVRHLHRLTTHSLRHYAITSFAKQTNGNLVLTSRFARHSDPSTTMTYISARKEELYKEIDSTFSLERFDKLKRSVTTASTNSQY
jgi:integrase